MVKSLIQTFRKRVQATVSLLVLLSLFVPFSTTYLWLHIQKRLIKKEVKAKLIRGIDKSELTHFTFSKTQVQTELRWEHHKEFEYKGEMYDVVETEVKGDSIHYVCWHDKAETKLNKRLKTLIAQATSGSPEHQKRESLCYQLLKSLVMQNATQLWLEPSESLRKFYTPLVQYESIALQKVKKPPPFVSRLA
ncbi:MAG: hypothetical protein ACK412_03120 [Chloroherpetonaceae bacterium]